MFRIRNCLKQRDALLPSLFNFALDYAIMRVRGNQNGLKLNGTHQLPVYTVNINVLGGSVHKIKKKKAEAVGHAVASKEIGLETNAD
jgi:hypothetical protein